MNSQKHRNTNPRRQDTAKQQGTTEHQSTDQRQDTASHKDEQLSTEGRQDIDSSSTEEQSATDKRKPPEPGQGWLGRLSTRQGVALLIGGSALFILIAVAAALYFFIYPKRSPEIQPILTPPASLSDLVKEFPELASILNDARLDSVFKDFLIAYQRGGAEAAYDLAVQRGLLNKKDELILTLELDTTDTAALKSELEAYGIKVTTVSGNLMDIAVPLEIIQKSIESGDPAGIFNNIAGLEHVKRIRMPIPYMENDPVPIPIPYMDLKGLAWPLKVGDVDSESLQLIGASRWQENGFTGRGIKIGIVDAGDFARYTELLGTDLPSSVTARSFSYDVELEEEGDQHGTACAEIIHDIAPDAELVFAAFHTDAEFDQAVDWIVSQGVQIISNSTGSVAGPFDGTRSDCQLVNRVVGSGILWVNSSGNQGDKHYRGTFRDENGNGFHEFEDGSERLMFAAPEGLRTFILNWDDWQNRDQDFNLYIYDKNETLIAGSENIQNGSGVEPIEFVKLIVPEDARYYASFYAARATRPVVFDYHIQGLIKYPVPEYSLTNPATASQSLTVGAVNWENDALEDFSSQGPTSDGRFKPELAAPDMVTSVAYGEAWPGTSAACPHVAGAAALVLGAYPNSTTQQVTEFLESRAVDLGASGPDYAHGYGRLWLGDPPGESSMPTPTESSAFLPPGNTTTPTRRHTATPTSSEDESETEVTLGMLMCVVAPGLIGLAGIGLLGMVLFRRRSQPAVYAPSRYSFAPSVYPRTPPGAPAIPPVHPPAAPPEPRVGAEVEGRNICPRCGISHRPQAQFCPVCGFALKPGLQSAQATVYCTYCGKIMLPNSRFCTKCGKPRR